MTEKVYCGIDPGYVTGGVAIVSGDWGEVHDLPTFESGGINCHELDHILNSTSIDFVVIEKQGARPMQNVSSTFNLAMAYGQILGCLQMVGLRHEIHSPHSWKKKMRVTKDKDYARQLAIQQFPKLAVDLKLKKHEHRAEALLLAAYARELDRG